MDEYEYREDPGRDRVAHVAIWVLRNLSLLFAVAGALVANAWMYGQTSPYLSAWGTAVATCLGYALVEKAPLLATPAGTRRTVMDWAKESADRVADWAGWEWDEDENGWV